MHGLYYPMALDTNLRASVGYWGRGAWDQTLLWDHTCKSWYQIGMFWWWWSQSRDQHLWVVIHSTIKALEERSFVEEWTYEIDEGLFCLVGGWGTRVCDCCFGCWVIGFLAPWCAEAVTVSSKVIVPHSGYQEIYFTESLCTYSLYCF